MMGHKICFYEQIWLIIPKLSLLPFLSGALTLEVPISIDNILFIENFQELSQKYPLTLPLP